jgi:spore coat polysaccharide biosynthesis protein SpsF
MTRSTLKEKLKVGFLITARLKSTRLPMKLLAEVEGRPIFSHMIDRLKLTRTCDQVIVCTSTNPQDDPLERIAADEGIACFRGDEADVVKRNYDAATAFELDYILSITGDCPFCDPVYADRIVREFQETQADFIRALDLPHGAYSYGINPSALRKVLDIKDQEDTETWGGYFTDTDLFKVHDLEITNPRHRQPELRMTLDYAEDLEFFRVVFTHLYKPGSVFSLDEILDFLEEHPEVVAINSYREADYLKRWTRQSAIKLKPRYDVKRAVVIGAGSMGRRHIRNLRKLGISEVAALRSGEGTRKSLDPGLGVLEIDSWSQFSEFKPDITIISNPSSLHLNTIRNCLSSSRGIFIEKPLATSLEGVSELIRQIKSARAVAFVGFNLQFHPAIKAITRILDSEQIGNPLVLQCQVGQWVEDWHPEEDYRASYLTRRELGGGVTLTLIHELNLAYELLGAAERVGCFQHATDLLKLEVDTVSDLMIAHANGRTSQIHLDLVQRPANRRGIISCERGWVSYDLVGNRVEMRTADAPDSILVWSDPGYDLNQSYLDEMQRFIQYVQEGRIRHEYDARKGSHSVAIAASAFRSVESNCFEAIPDWVRALK